MKLVEEVAVAAELTGTTLSQAAAMAMTEELACYDRQMVSGALRKCRRELKGRLTLAAIIERLDDGRPGVEEAWALLPRDEASSAVWTEEMSKAFGVAAGLMAEGSMVEARMAFKECYLRLVDEARNEGKPVSWNATLGRSVHGREAALLAAVDKGRITLERAREFVPLLNAPDPKILAIAGSIVRKVERLDAPA